VPRREAFVIAFDVNWLLWIEADAPFEVVHAEAGATRHPRGVRG
jgi:hypothetical protein